MTTFACNCIGPQNGEPKCPCLMRGIIERDGRWVQLERDLGPVRRVAPVTGPQGCICPSGAERTCQGSLCPRKPFRATAVSVLSSDTRR